MDDYIGGLTLRAKMVQIGSAGLAWQRVET